MRAFCLAMSALLALGAFASLGVAQDRGRGADVTAGRQLAINVCEECHVVASHVETPSSLRGYGPSFLDIANKPGTTEQSLRAFLAHPHALAKMPYPDLTAQQTTTVAAYILSLRQSH